MYTLHFKPHGAASWEQRGDGLEASQKHLECIWRVLQERSGCWLDLWVASIHEVLPLVNRFHYLMKRDNFTMWISRRHQFWEHSYNELPGVTCLPDFARMQHIRYVELLCGNHVLVMIFPNERFSKKIECVRCFRKSVN